MQRFFIEPSLLQQPLVILPQPVSHQLAVVLRARVGDHVILLNDTGIEFEAELTTVSPRQVEVRIVTKSSPEREPHLQLVLYQALVKETKMDLVLQKGTELGAARFVPLICERSLKEAPNSAKFTRWGRIIKEAAEQSGRTRLPKLEPPMQFKEACSPPPVLRLLAAPNQALSLTQALPEHAPGEISLLVGPEGGFSEAEIAFASSRGVGVVQMGKRILRTETAGLAALAIIMAKYGEL